jgi:succinate dehydrogenase/fumarate reductase-like Fe-S protein
LRTKTYKVPVREGMTVLTAALHQKISTHRHLALFLGNICGSCGMPLNGSPTLACNT